MHGRIGGNTVIQLYPDEFSCNPDSANSVLSDESRERIRRYRVSFCLVDNDFADRLPGGLFCPVHIDYVVTLTPVKT